MSVTIDAVKTAEDLLKFSPYGRYELIKGVMYKLSPPGLKHGIISWKIIQRLGSFVEKNKLGVITSSETGFKLSSNPDTVRGADAAFISNEKLTKSGIIDGYPEIMPDLVVEVNSPSDNFTRVLKKVNEWIDAGVREVWVFEPEDKTVVIYHSGNKSEIYEYESEIEGRGLLAGFKCKVKEIFDLSGYMENHDL